jgi:undecaprenyl-diphosphatase
MTKKKPDIARKVEKADGAAARAVRPYRETLAVRALSYASKLGDQPPLRTLCAATIAAGLAGGNARLARAGARMLAAHTLATLAKDALKRRIDRTRPRSNGNARPAIEPGGHTSKEETSFPSGHSAGAAAVASAFARDFPEYRWPAYAAAGAIALAQVPRCSHYPSDVGAGLGIGIAADAAIAAGARLLDTTKSDDGR